MYKFIVLGVFLFIFIFLIKKNRVYVIPFILIIYTNINGLLDWEDFAFHGVIKFQDYGLAITLILLFFSIPKSGKSGLRRVEGKATYWLYSLIMAYWIYYVFEFIYSIVLQGNIEWPLKLGRAFFYGIVFFLIYKRLRPDPIVLYEKIVKVLMAGTLIFGMMYITYNLLGVDFYPKEAYETFSVDGMRDVTRNFAGFPAFTFYFLILFVHRLMQEKNSALRNCLGAMLMAACVVLTLTRGAVVTMIAVIILTIAFRRLTVASIRKTLLIFVGSLLTLSALMTFAQGYVDVLTARFGEFGNVNGAINSGNFLVRSVEFFKIVENVLNFNPLFGFGFTNVSELGLGYQSKILTAGSADNGFSNLIGVTGFFGLGIFLLVMFAWLVVNVKLQLLAKERFSKVNFIFIIYMIASMFDGSTPSYMHYYALFLAYDLAAYGYLRIDSMSRSPVRGRIDGHATHQGVAL